MAYVDLYAAATLNDAVEQPLFQQVAVAVKKAAYDVTNEDPGTGNHAERLQWARNVHLTSDGPQTWAKKMIWRVLDNATIAAAPTTATDADVQFTVNALVDEFALG